jgi:hypothetical protein
LRESGLPKILCTKHLWHKRSQLKIPNPENLGVFL